MDIICLTSVFLSFIILSYIIIYFNLLAVYKILKVIFFKYIMGVPADNFAILLFIQYLETFVIMVMI